MTNAHENKQDAKQTRVGFTGGGSGGHVYPISALLQHVLHDTDLHAKCKSLTRYGEKNSLEESIAAQYSEVEFIPVLSGKLRRYYDLKSILQSIIDMFKVVGSLFSMIYEFFKRPIDVLFCKGGYVTVPVAFAARLHRIPIIVHDSDTHVGLANRIVSPLASVKLQGFDGTFYNGFTVGQLLSRQLLHFTKDYVRPGYTHCLVTGGSQGASTLFEVISKLAPRYTNTIHFSLITGTKNQLRIEKLNALPNCTAYPLVSQEEMASLLYAADCSITRGSATSLAEQQLFGIKKCIVPLPYTGGDHQTKNALRYERTHGDVHIAQSDDLQDQIAHRLDGVHGYSKPAISTEQLAQQVEHGCASTRNFLIQKSSH